MKLNAYVFSVCLMGTKETVGEIAVIAKDIEQANLLVNNYVGNLPYQYHVIEYEMNQPCILVDCRPVME